MDLGDPFFPFLLFAIGVVNIGAIGVLMALLPRISRRDLFFAVTVPPEFSTSPEAQDLVQQYRRAVAKHSLAWTAVLAMGVAAEWFWPGLAPLSAIALSVVVLGTTATTLVALIRARRRVLPHSVSPSKVCTYPQKPKLATPAPSAGRILFAAGPFLLIAATSLILWLTWDQIPVRYPSRWGVSGETGGWTERSPLSLGIPLIIAVVLNAIVILIHAVAMAQVPRTFSGGAALYEHKARTIIGTLIYTVCWFMSLTFCAIALLVPLASSSAVVPAVLIVGAVTGELVLLGIMAVLMTRYGEAMETARSVAIAEGHEQSAIIGDRTEDRYWKGGVIYWNPDDPAIWVEKRIGVGWTTNMAHWQGWAWPLGIIGAVLLLVALMMWLV